MRLPLLAELAVLAGSAALVRCTAMADTQPGSDTDAEAVLLYDPPILRAQFLPSNEPGKVDSRSVLDLLLGRRQTCNAGYGYCRGDSSRNCRVAQARHITLLTRTFQSWASAVPTATGAAPMATVFSRGRRAVPTGRAAPERRAAATITAIPSAPRAAGTRATARPGTSASCIPASPATSAAPTHAAPPMSPTA